MPELTEDDLPSDPIALAQRWFADAQAAEIEQADAMTLATSTPDGRPSARAVLLKGIDARGFAFFTNYESRKARELDANPRAALVLLWVPLQRQLRVAGTVVRLSAEESDAYFATRARGSQLGAWASEQSRPLPDRSALEERWAALDERYGGGAVPRPPHWGGYRVEPDEIEVWQGRANRLHDRFAYTRTPDGWERVRLQP
ncbi:MAG TPA: pyridoxamine 5'-phosphate oxidase [Conexibacter sp.]|jgi:pyridoxamine 5'-phosphate oxidase|nr:pyridoxamine 5'-phosphate oxidase [Conexibacter sp.]